MKKTIDGRHYVLLGVCGILCVASIFLSVVGSSALTASLTRQDQRITQLRNEITLKEAENQALADQVVFEASGLNVNKIETDRRKIAGLCSLMFNWSTQDDYNMARSTLLEEYHVDPDGYLMTVFFPPVVELNMAEHGVVYREIDERGINCSYDGSTVYLNGAVGLDYSYLVTVTFSSRSANNYEAMSTAMLLCSVDADGNFHDISGYVAY